MPLCRRVAGGATAQPPRNGVRREHVLDGLAPPYRLHASGPDEHARRAGDGVELVGYRLGVDVGGTHTDLVLLNVATGDLMVEKVSSTPKNPALGVLNGVMRFVARGGRFNAAGGIHVFAIRIDKIQITGRFHFFECNAPDHLVVIRWINHNRRLIPAVEQNTLIARFVGKRAGMVRLSG
ncbi:MAG: hypothetical protein EBT83_08745 [Betaproteobacteria bacterium]|nr:hypothetical protein [Betaproteobacteria bacterium]